MSRSNDAGHFFQTTDAIAETERKAAKAKNQHGNPIKLPSKILAAHHGSSSETIYVAEAAGEIKRVHLESGKIDRVFTQGNAPLTCLTIDPQTNTLFAGSWDKQIHCIPLTSSPSPFDTTKLSLHTDFIKCILHTRILGDNKPLLISGSADAQIIIWDLSLTPPQPLHKLKGHVKALQAFAIDPLSISPDSFTLFSASSDREIRRWHVSLSTAHELAESIQSPIRTHETSVYKLLFDSEADLWTCSADKTSQHLVRTRSWESDTTLPHPDFVRDVALFENLGLIVTACRDEDVRVWDVSSGELVCTFKGHYEEVTALVPLVGKKAVVSVSIDGTVRKWSLEKGDMERYREDLAREEAGEMVSKEETSTQTLTAEEEAELAELMDDDDE